MKKVIMDVDTGIDDAMAIMLGIQSKKLDILGITTVNGNVSLEKTTENTVKILKLLEVSSLIPVYKGASHPLMRERVSETKVHGLDGMGGALGDLNVNVPKTLFASDFIIDTVLQNKNDVTLIMTGPLTNLALALQKNSKIKDYLNEVVVMGGTVGKSGNYTLSAEYNIFADPESAKIVYESGVPLTQVGLDVTSRVLLKESHIQQLVHKHIREFIQTSTYKYFDRYSDIHGNKAFALHDPLTVGVVIDPSLVKTDKLRIDIETESEFCDGQTICDFKNKLGRPPNVNVCLDVDVNKFMGLFVQCLNKV